MENDSTLPKRRWKKAGPKCFEINLREECMAEIFGSSVRQRWAWAVYGKKFYKAGVNFRLKLARSNANAAIDDLLRGEATR